MKKHLLLLMTIAIMAIFVASCGDKKEDTKPTQEPQKEMTTPAETPAETPATEEATPEEEPVVAEEIEEKAPAETKEAEKQPTTQSTPPKSGEMTGVIVAFDEVVKGQPGTFTNAEVALSFYEKGALLAFQSDGKNYLVFTESGSYAGKRLLKYSTKKEVKIKGKVSTKNGLPIIMMTGIE